MLKNDYHFYKSCKIFNKLLKIINVFYISGLLNKNKNFSKDFALRTWIYKNTIRSSSYIPNFNKNYNELKIKIFYSKKLNSKTKSSKKMGLSNFTTLSNFLKKKNIKKSKKNVYKIVSNIIHL